jgi:hypothetical protein
MVFFEESIDFLWYQTFLIIAIVLPLSARVTITICFCSLVLNCFNT